MKNNLEKAKDIFYNISDYLIMGAIVLVIGIIIIWRLEVLFPENTSASVLSNVEVKTQALDTVKVSKDEVKEDSVEELEENPEIIKISIPRGSPTSNIASILLDSKLINSVDEFEQKVDELNLETALRSGEYDIATNSSLEHIIKTIANKI